MNMNVDKFCLAALVFLSAGITFAWPSPALPQLLAVDSSIPITSDESSWLVAMAPIGVVLAAIPTGWMMDKIGRKYTILLSVIPLFLTWILIGVGNSIVELYISRLFSGYYFSMAYAVTPMYLGEISSDSIRGSIGAIQILMLKLGILFAYAVGSYTSFRLSAWLSMIPIIPFVITFIWCPESPYHLLANDNQIKAKENLQKLRQVKNVDEELERMYMSVKVSQEHRGNLNELLNKSNRKSLIIALGLGMAQNFSGSLSIIPYTHIIFGKINSNLQMNEASIIFGVVQLLSVFIAIAAVDRLGRRPLLLLSTSVVCLCNAIIGTYFLLERYFDVSVINWLPITMIMIFFIFNMMGLSPISIILIGEIFPKNVKAIAVVTIQISNAITSFTVNKLFQVVSDGLGSDYTFFGFAIITFLFVFFIYFLIPETKGKTFNVILEDIHHMRKTKRLQ